MCATARSTVHGTYVNSRTLYLAISINSKDFGLLDCHSIHMPPYRGHAMWSNKGIPVLMMGGVPSNQTLFTYPGDTVGDTFSGEYHLNIMQLGTDLSSQ